MKKSHWISLVILAILVGLYFLARNWQPVEREARFFRADSAQVVRLEFSTPGDTVIIGKADKQWKLLYPVVWDVNEQQLSTFFNQVLAAKTSATPMSEDAAQQQLYKVDSLSAVRVRIYGQGEELLDHAFIGNGTDTSFDYGRRQGELQIYQFRDNLTNLVRPDVFLWRSPNITNLKRAQMDKIEVTLPDHAYTLTLLPDSIRYTDPHESFIIHPHNRAQYKIINVLENLMTWQFVDTGTEQYEQAFRAPDCRVKVTLKDRSVRTFTLIRIESGAPPDPGSPINNEQVMLKLDDKPAPLYQMTGDFLQRFTKTAGSFKAMND